jgi:hypothetical protein
VNEVPRYLGEPLVLFYRCTVFTKRRRRRRRRRREGERERRFFEDLKMNAGQ